jgi:ATP-dependent DNA helicase PIF1
MNLKLKVGAQVMFTKNDGEKRWVNGTLGIIKEINQDEGYIKVQILSDAQLVTVNVKRESWKFFKYKIEGDKIVQEKIGEYIQFPLMLGWAITIYKSQSKTFQKVMVDLGNGAFATEQTYVALSRIRKMEDLFLRRNLRENDIKCCPIIKNFYSGLYL